MDENSKAQKFYKGTKSFRDRRTNWYVENEEERHELLLIKMMKYVSQNCPADDYSLFVKKLHLDEEDVKKVNSNKEAANNIKLMSLFSTWRMSKSCSAVDAQNKFVHIVDLVDLPPIVARLNAFRVYAKAVAL